MLAWLSGQVSAPETIGKSSIHAHIFPFICLLTGLEDTWFLHLPYTNNLSEVLFRFDFNRTTGQQNLRDTSTLKLGICQVLIHNVKCSSFPNSKYRRYDSGVKLFFRHVEIHQFRSSEISSALSVMRECENLDHVFRIREREYRENSHNWISEGINYVCAESFVLA